MAYTQNTIIRCRPGGAATNGGGFDPTVTSPGTDYSRQDAAQVTYADLVIGASNTLTSAANPFTAAHVGNAIAISGGTGFTVGRYAITAVSGSTATLNTSPGTVGSTGGAGKLGGAVTLSGAWGSGTGAPFFASLVPGNTVYVLGVAGNAASYPTGSTDYTITSYGTPPAGNDAAGPIRWIADPTGPKPTILGNGLTFYNVQTNWFEGLYFTLSGNSTGSLGILNVKSQSLVRGCDFNLASQAGVIGVVSTGSVVLGCDFFGGSTSPTTSAGSYLLSVGGTTPLVAGNRLRHGRDAGLVLASGAIGPMVVGNLIYGCAGRGIDDQSTANAPYMVARNTIDNNGGHGIALGGTAAVCYANVYDNLITNHTATGSAGLYVASGSQTLNDFRKRLLDYNAFYNNAVSQGSGTNVSLGARDVTGANPGYADAANGDFTPSNAALQTGFP